MGTFGRIRTLAAVTAAVIWMTAGAVAQELPKIAVYVTGNAKEDEKKALGTRILVSLVNSGRYKAIERSNSFLAEIAKEQVKQRSGDIDDNQISALGKQFGVKFVCIADITPAFGEYQVSARIVNVETAEVEFIGDASGSLNSMTDLERISNLVVNNMFNRQTANITESKPAPKPELGSKVTSTTFVDSRDGKTYKKVTIGTKTWMAENLSYNAKGSKYYNNKSANGGQYGMLYNWSTAKGACPAGWYLPNGAEWQELVDFAGGSKTAGRNLKSIRGYDGTDKYGFSALPGGYGIGAGSFYYIGKNGYWWSTTGAVGMYYGIDSVDVSNKPKASLFSVRCVED